MNLQEHIQLLQDGTEAMLITDCWYTIDDEGKRKSPVIHVAGQTMDGYRHVAVTDFLPYFFITEQTYFERQSDIQQEIDREPANQRILDVEWGHEGIATGGTVSLVKLICRVPWDVPQIRAWFDRTWEADVLFSDRFLTDQNITNACTVPTDRDVITPDAIQPYDDPIDIDPRIVTYDIEVYVGDGGFPDPTLAEQPVTAITAHDSQTDTYWTGVTAHPKWGIDHVLMRDIRAIYDETAHVGECVVFEPGRDDELVYTFIEWLRDKRPQYVVAWNDAFDAPYVVNRAIKTGCENVQSLSPTGNVEWIDDPDWETSDAINGLPSVDAMDIYEKTIIKKQKSMTLEAVANRVLGEGKVDLDGADAEAIDNAWVDDPEKFVEYSIRDVAATVGIIDECGGTQLFENLQALTGTEWPSLPHNSQIIDDAILRNAQHN